MLWFIGTAIFGLIGIGALLVAWADSTARAGGIGVSVACGVLWTVLTLFSVFSSIQAGHVGLVKQFGAIKGQTGSGLVEVWPWQTVTDANTQTQSFQFKLDGFTKETQNVFVLATLNYQVAPKDVQTLYRHVGSNYFNILVPQRVNQAFKDEVVKFRAVQIAPHRNQIRDDVLRQLKADLAPFSIQATALNIDNISFSQAFTNAIEDKQIATQQAQAAQNRVQTAKYRAQQIVAAAQGQADANKLKRQTLTPLLVEQNMVDKLSPNVKVILLPSTGGFLLPQSLFSSSTAADPAVTVAPVKKK